MEPTRLPDPFAIQSDPRLYVPRRGTEEALDELERAAFSPRHAVLLFTGPPGIGKTLLLHVLAEELAPRLRTAYLPYARLPAGGLWTWAARELGLEAGGEPKQALRRLLGELAAEGRGLLLAIDDASSLPADALADLIVFARAEPALRVVLAFSEGERLAGPVPDEAPVVRLDRPMSRVETQDYVLGRLARCGAPRSVIDRFDTATVARLHRESEGVPLRVHGVADAVLREEGAPAPGAAAEAAPRIEPRAPSPLPPTELTRPAEAAAPTALSELPAVPRARPRSRRRRRALGRVAWAAAGLCVGLAAGLVVGPLADRVGLRERDLVAGRDAQAPAPVSPAPEPQAAPAAEPPVALAPEQPVAPVPAEPVAPRVEPPAEQAPAASVPEPERAPAAAVAAAPPTPEPAREQATPGGGEPAPAVSVRTEPAAQDPGQGAAAPEEAAGIASAPPPAPPPTADARTPPAPRADSAPRPDVSAASPAAAPAAPSEAAPPEAPLARPAPRTAPLATGSLAVFAEEEVEIEIDGRRVGAPPLAGIRLRRGPHRVVAHYRDGRVGQKTVVLGDEDVSVTFR